MKAGLGDPPARFTTNASESMNALLKKKVNYKKNELPLFIDELKSVIEEQERELERAVINTGFVVIISMIFKRISEYEYVC